MDYLSYYAGRYAIKTNDFRLVEVEFYHLMPNGKAVYKFEEAGRHNDTKLGTWTARENEIDIVIRGKSGFDIEERYRSHNGVFRCGHQYLEKRKTDFDFFADNVESN